MSVPWLSDLYSTGMQYIVLDTLIRSKLREIADTSVLSLFAAIAYVH